MEQQQQSKRVADNKQPIVVTSCKRTPMQDVIGVYMSTKKNAKCMTLLMLKEEYKSRVGQLAEAAAARVLRREVGHRTLA
jgi:hypothetical protein